MYWLMLIVAGLFETGFAICLGKARETTGNESVLWLGGFAASLVISMLLLYRATRFIPIGTAYAVWTGIGTAGTVLAGIFLFREPADSRRLFFLVMLIVSIVGLRLVSK
ncbi:MAG TPA: multidrug efflux SMR transporter [Bacteroidetes bacterium]|nr:multidrug efflux SMR transporter [Bacteroidota bacterium]